MVCIHCGAETKVINSRLQKRANHVWRRRKCDTCSAVFTSQEKADYSASVAVRDAQGALQPFLRDKLLLSLHASLQHRPEAVKDASALVETVIARLLVQAQHSIINDYNIATTAYLVLARFDKAAATHYQAFHRL